MPKRWKKSTEGDGGGHHCRGRTENLNVGIIKEPSILRIRSGCDWKQGVAWVGATRKEILYDQGRMPPSLDQLRRVTRGMENIKAVLAFCLSSTPPQHDRLLIQVAALLDGVDGHAPPR